MATPTPSEAERYRYLKLKQKQAMAQQQPQEQQVQQTTGRITGQDIQEHPLKALLRAATQPVSKSIAGTTMGQQYDKRGLGTVPFQMMDSIGQGKNPIAQAGAFGQSFMGGMAADVADLAQTPSFVPAMKGLGKAAQILRPLLKFKKLGQQAEQSKQALDALEQSYESAYGSMIDEVKDIPTKFDFKDLPGKIIRMINRDGGKIYNVEKETDGSIKQTIGNLAKIKKAVSDTLTPAVRQHAGKTEQALIQQYEGKLSSAMKEAAKDAGKPIDEGMKAYGEFKQSYNLVYDKFVIKQQAMHNQLKDMHRIWAEGKTKDAWKILSKQSPELKEVMNSRRNRELLKALLVPATTGGAYEVGKKVITGNF